MLFRSKLAFLLLAALIIAVILWLYNRYPSDVKDEHLIDTVRVGYIPYTADLAYFVAEHEEFFSKSGVKIIAHRFPTSGACLDAVAAGKIDAAMGNSFTGILINEAKRAGTFKIGYVLLETEQNYASRLLVRMDSEILTLSDLKG